MGAGDERTRRDGTGDWREQRRAAAYARARAQLERAFDPDVGLCLGRTELAARHIPRTSLDYARCLLRDGDDAAATLARRIVERALDAQELEPGHPHHGGFRFGLEDDEVTGLNVTSFVLLRLLALWTEHGDRLPAALRATLQERVRYALAEIARVGVTLRYTNPALMDCANTILWGEQLDEPALAGAGKARLDAWIAFTASAGAPYEYNSPGYIAVDLTVLATLANLTRDPQVRLKALLMEERLWLHALLHFHAATGQQAGPHSRAYHGGMHGGAEGIYQLLWQELGLDLPVPSPYLNHQPQPSGLEAALTRYHCPPHVADWARAQAAHYPYTVRETADRASGADLTTYCTGAYALGTASRTYTIGQHDFDIEHEANHCILHYRCREPALSGAQERTTNDESDEGESSPRPSSLVLRQPGWRTLYTRFVVNDRYLGSIEQHAIKSRRTNFYDQGLFAGHQHRNVAIALYGLELQSQGISSVELLVVMPGPVRPRALHAGAKRLTISNRAAAPIPDGTWIIVEDGEVWVGIWPLERDQMGRQRGMEVRHLPTGELALAMPHYRGAEKWFWEYASAEGAFYRRNIRSGLVLVAGDRATYPTLEAYAAHLARARIRDTLDGTCRTVSYRNSDAWLEIAYDLARNETIERRIDGKAFEPPALDAPWAVQVCGHPAALGEASLDAGAAPAVLFARDAVTAPALDDAEAGIDGSTSLWEALILSDALGPVRLTTPAGVVACDAFGFGSIRIEAPRGGRAPAAVTIRYTEARAPIHLPPPAAGHAGYTLNVNGIDVSGATTPYHP